MKALRMEYLFYMIFIECHKRYRHKTSTHLVEIKRYYSMLYIMKCAPPPTHTHTLTQGLWTFIKLH